MKPAGSFRKHAIRVGVAIALGIGFNQIINFALMRPLVDARNRHIREIGIKKTELEGKWGKLNPNSIYSANIYSTREENGMNLKQTQIADTLLEEIANLDKSLNAMKEREKTEAKSKTLLLILSGFIALIYYWLLEVTSAFNKPRQPRLKVIWRSGE